jgi:hypothetical protein
MHSDWRGPATNVLLYRLFVKLSIAFFNRLITGLCSRKWLVVHWIFIVVFLYLLPITISLRAFQVRPVRAGYSLKFVGTMTNPREIVPLNRRAISISTRVLHIVTDVALLCVPITIVLRLKMPKRSKAHLTAIFAIDGMSTLASILRNVIMADNLKDPTYEYYAVYV